MQSIISERRCGASLIPKSMHDPALLDLLRRPVSREMIAYVAQKTTSVIVVDELPLPTPPHTPLKQSFAEQQAQGQVDPGYFGHTGPYMGLPPLDEFITHLVESANVQTPTLLATIIYLERLKSKLPRMAKGEWHAFCLLFK